MIHTSLLAICTSPNLQDLTAIAWDKLGIVGTTVVGILVVVLFFLRYLSDQRKHDAEQRKEFFTLIGEQRQEFSTTLRDLTKQFGDRVEGIADAVTSSNERVETAMRDLAIDVRGAHAAGSKSK